MNHFSYDDIVVGQTAEFSREITAEMMERFRDLSGDENPLHKDEDYAKGKGFPGRVVYGMLTSSLYSCLGGCTYLESFAFCKVYTPIFSARCSSAINSPLPAR